MAINMNMTFLFQYFLALFSGLYIILFTIGASQKGVNWIINIEETHDHVDTDRHMSLDPNRYDCAGDFDMDGVHNCDDEFPLWDKASAFNSTSNLPYGSATHKGCKCGEACVTKRDKHFCELNFNGVTPSTTDPDDYHYNRKGDVDRSDDGVGNPIYSDADCIAVYDIQLQHDFKNCEGGSSASNKDDKVQSEVCHAFSCCAQGSCTDAPASVAAILNASDTTNVHVSTEYATRISLGLMETCAEVDTPTRSKAYNHKLELECMDTSDILRNHMDSDSESTVFEVWYNFHWVVLALASVHLVIVGYCMVKQDGIGEAKPFTPPLGYKIFDVIIPAVVFSVATVTLVFYIMLQEGDNNVKAGEKYQLANITLVGGNTGIYQHFDFELHKDHSRDHRLNENVIMSDVMHSIPKDSADRYTGWGVTLIIAYICQILSTVFYMAQVPAYRNFLRMNQQTTGSQVSAPVGGDATAQPPRSIYASASKLAF